MILFEPAFKKFANYSVYGRSQVDGEVSQNRCQGVHGIIDDLPRDPKIKSFFVGRQFVGLEISLISRKNTAGKRKYAWPAIWTDSLSQCCLDKRGRGSREGGKRCSWEKINENQKEHWSSSRLSYISEARACNFRIDREERLAGKQMWSEPTGLLV